MYEVRRRHDVTLTEADYALIAALARRDRLSLSEWIRRCVTDYLVAHGEAPLTMRGRNL